MTNRDYALEEHFRSEMIGGREVLIGLDQGEIPNGARVVLINSEPSDVFRDGAMGTVVGALETNEEVRAECKRRGTKQAKWIYWVKFDYIPEISVAITDFKIKWQEDIFIEGG